MLSALLLCSALEALSITLFGRRACIDMVFWYTHLQVHYVKDAYVTDIPRDFMLHSSMAVMIGIAMANYDPPSGHAEPYGCFETFQSS